MSTCSPPVHHVFVTCLSRVYVNILDVESSNRTGNAIITFLLIILFALPCIIGYPLSTIRHKKTPFNRAHKQKINQVEQFSYLAFHTARIYPNKHISRTEASLPTQLVEPNIDHVRRLSLIQHPYKYHGTKSGSEG